MATPLDVLAWLDSLHSTAADGAVMNEKWPEAQQVRAAVAELIEAAQWYVGRPYSDGGHRIASALARIRGAK